MVLGVFRPIRVIINNVNDDIGYAWRHTVIMKLMSLFIIIARNIIYSATISATLAWWGEVVTNIASDEGTTCRMIGERLFTACFQAFISVV